MSHTHAGMLSKSKGQLLRVAAVMHVLFNLDAADPSQIPKEIAESAVVAADCFIDICLQNAAYLGGKGDLKDAIEEINQGMFDSHNTF